MWANSKFSPSLQTNRFSNPDNRSSRSEKIGIAVKNQTLILLCVAIVSVVASATSLALKGMIPAGTVLGLLGAILTGVFALSESGSAVKNAATIGAIALNAAGVGTNPVISEVENVAKTVGL